MSSINRSLAGPMLTFRLADQIAELRGEDTYRRSGRSGRTLAKSGRLRVVLTVLSPGTLVGTHQAESPMTVQVLEGRIRFRMDATEHTLEAGELLYFGAGDAHDIRADGEETAFLLTLSAIGGDVDSAEGPR
jgi:quercetin dioxygenase-like cupin family protein